MVPGKLNNPITSCCREGVEPKVTSIMAASESGAAFMADGFARVTGNVGVCVVIGGRVPQMPLLV